MLVDFERDHTRTRLLHVDFRDSDEWFRAFLTSCPFWDMLSLHSSPCPMCKECVPGCSWTSPTTFYFSIVFWVLGNKFNFDSNILVFLQEVSWIWVFSDAWFLIILSLTNLCEKFGSFLFSCVDSICRILYSIQTTGQNPWRPRSFSNENYTLLLVDKSPRNGYSCF